MLRKEEKMVIRLFRRHIVIACVGILAGVVAVTMAVNHCGEAKPGHTQQAVKPGAHSEPNASSQALHSAGTKEMRAVWVPYMSLNMSYEKDKSEQSFMKKFDAIIHTAKSCGMNTLVVQVRPFSDALYKSQYYPWSHILSGAQGKDPGYDPLKDMVTEGHKNGLKIHAWINPLRISISGMPSSLSNSNPCCIYQKDASKSCYISNFKDGTYYNPAYDEVRRLVADGAKEIAQKYDVDGIQFDDYFYPTQDTSFDGQSYSSYCSTAKKAGMPLSLEEWRCANINSMVALVYREIKSVKPGLQFGIAPQGNTANDMKMGADVYAWCSAKGYIDYICPQLYYNFQNPVLPFSAAANTWRTMVKNKDIKLYFGLAAYKAGSGADSGTWKNSSTILAGQVQYGRQVKCDGFMFYSCEFLNSSQTKDEIQNVVKLLN